MDIRKVIKERGLSIKDVAAKLGIRDTALNNRINRNTSIDLLREIAEAIGCKVGDFFADEMTVPSTDTSALKCPHCGEPIHIKAEK